MVEEQDQDTLLLSSLQVASNAWLSFDWNNRQQAWSKTKDECKELKESSLAARKLLAETTKAFKRSVKSTEQASSSLSKNKSSEEHIATTIKCIDSLSKDCKKTIKSYQEEIDNLTKRCKVSDNAFTTLYTGLNDLPDPTSLLGMSMQCIDGQKQHIQQLLNTLDKVNKEMSEMEDHYKTTKDNHNSNIKDLKEENETLKKELEEKVGSAPNSGNGGGGGSLNKEEREELIQLRREVSEYEIEFRGLKNQDITIRKLEAKIQELQENSEEQLEERTSKIKQDIEETEGRKAIEALEREAAMERKVQTLELQLKSERAGKEATQTYLLEADDSLGQREAAWEAQRQILLDDTSRLREMLHVTTKERDNLRLRVSALGGEDDAAAPKSGNLTSLSASPASGNTNAAIADMVLERKAYEAEVSELSQAANLLREDLRIKDEQLQEEKAASKEQITKLTNEKSLLSDEISKLSVQLSLAPSQELVDNMKHELSVLKKLEYNVDDDDDDVDNERDPEMTTSGNKKENDLESVLVKKMRRLESDIVRERTKKTELSKEYEQIQERLIASEKAKDEAEKLVISLESDLQKAISSPMLSPENNKSQRKKISTPSIVAQAENPDTLQRILDPDNAPKQSPSSKNNDNLVKEDTDDVAAITQTVLPLTAGSASTSAAEKASDDHSVATIVMAQRDRLRAKCDAVEAERDSFKRELQLQVQTAESLKADNTKLYEKVKYLQSYNKTRSGNNAYTRSNSKDLDLDLEALEQRYEATVDPFRQFSRAERQRKFQEMSAMERAVFVVAKTVLGTKQMRTGLFFYMVLLHSLVFLTTYQFSHTSCNHANYHLMQEELIHLPPNKPQFEHADTTEQQKIHKLLGEKSLAGTGDADESTDVEEKGGEIKKEADSNGDGKKLPTHK